MLLVEPGRRAVRDGIPIAVGVPYGSKARLIMLYLMGCVFRRKPAGDSDPFQPVIPGSSANWVQVRLVL